MLSAHPASCVGDQKSDDHSQACLSGLVQTFIIQISHTHIMYKHAYIHSCDFNLHIDNPDDTYGCQFNNLLSSYGLVNHVTFPTDQPGHTLDLVITQNNQELELRSIKPGYFLSNHCFVCADIVIPQPHVQNR